MFCIAAFIVLVIISIFSARYRKMVKQAWGCVARKLTFRPCDTKFKDEVKSHLLAPVAVKHPKYLKAASIGVEVAAFIIVLLTLWSVYVVAKSGLNLYVYGTCNPSNASSCSIGAEACSIESAQPSFMTSLKDFKLHTWVANEVKSFGDTISAIPGRLRNWDAADYLPANATYEQPYDSVKPTALEIIDPGCQFCKQLYANQAEAGLANRYNVSYLAYPIEDSASPSGYKFKNSMLVTRYLEAAKLRPLDGAARHADWQILDRIFTWTDDKSTSYQAKINTLLSERETADLLKDWLKEIGYSDARVAELERLAVSSEVTEIIATNRRIVDEQVNTVKIPTVIMDGKRHFGVVSADDMR